MPASHFEDTSRQPGRWGSGPPREPERRRPEREPMFNAPWPAVVLVATIVGGYALQSWISTDQVNADWGYWPLRTEGWRWVTVVTSLGLHGSWPHALMNAAFALAFATPVARYFGGRPLGVVAFFAFYVLCGVVANLAYGALHRDSLGPLVGASGAVAGLMAAASRLVAGQGWHLGSIRSKPVLSMGAAWIGVNVLVALLGSQAFPGAGDATIAWEAHIAGFVAGLFLVTPCAWIARRR